MKNLLFCFLLLSVLSISCEKGPDDPKILADPYDSGIVSTVNNGREGEVTTLAGDGIVIESGFGADFVAPMDLKVGPDGNIYVADTYHYRIRRVSPDGEMSTITGDRMNYADGSFQEAAFIDIFFIAIAKDGSLVATEANADRIRRIKPD